MKSHLGLIASLILLISAGCQSLDSPTGTATPLPGSVSQSGLPSGTNYTIHIPILIDKKSSPQSLMTPILTIPFDPVFQAFIHQTKVTLAQESGVSLESIILVRTQEMLWPDTSLGCVQPGVVYAQVTTPGFYFEFAVSGRLYSYHTDTTGKVIHCTDQKVDELFIYHPP